MFSIFIIIVIIISLISIHDDERKAAQEKQIWREMTGVFKWKADSNLTFFFFFFFL